MGLYLNFNFTLLLCIWRSTFRKNVLTALFFYFHLHIEPEDVFHWPNVLPLILAVFVMIAKLTQHLHTTYRTATNGVSLWDTCLICLGCCHSWFVREASLPQQCVNTLILSCSASGQLLLPLNSHNPWPLRFPPHRKVLYTCVITRAFFFFSLFFSMVHCLSQGVSLCSKRNN